MFYDDAFDLAVEDQDAWAMAQGYDNWQDLAETELAEHGDRMVKDEKEI